MKGKKKRKRKRSFGLGSLLDFTLFCRWKRPKRKTKCLLIGNVSTWSFDLSQAGSRKKRNPKSKRKKRLQFSCCFGESIKPNFFLVLCTLGVGRWPKSETAFFWQKKRNNTTYFGVWSIWLNCFFLKKASLVSRKIQPLTFYNISPFKRQPLGGWYNYCIFM